ncbi:pyrroline-5-carboxylate reductase [Corynebacterium sp. TAE3-ERU12]|uniref:pyrroline-5-carboxylate reductase n=1 Tax=Corynebacterium sp. TAE3-ERU12 TaxID=2849491 RepID=UPI001C4833AF|nr:pyrroline-5-carboxylate reductase [Corynebacterium sp. TAE3-ERU12]MBV7294537.1 pyrroline-5-carboxylate reductase [Corynebacterium sp. TAE3-ERU12]
MTRIAVIGGGKIGTALIGGLIDGDVPPNRIHVADALPGRAEELGEQYGVTASQDAPTAAEKADVVFICVKPHDVSAALESIAAPLDEAEGDPVVVSMAAGLTLETLEHIMAAGTPVVRVMPNTPMLVGRGVSAIAPGRFASAEVLDMVAELLSKVGVVEKVTEAQMDAVTAISGSGPAYFFQFIEAMCDGGVSLGLSRDQAQRLAVETMAGAAEMLAAEGVDPVQLRANVSSPGGTTVAATRALDEHGLRGAVYAAMQACHDRSVELGQVE